ncbi:unnamed protein product [Brassica rapa subsp. trilocularis]
MTTWSPALILSMAAFRGFDEKGHPFHTCTAKGHWKKRCRIVSSSS